jgi:subtilase family serine protease
VVVKRKIPAPAGTPYPLIQPTASHFNDWVILKHKTICLEHAYTFINEINIYKYTVAEYSKGFDKHCRKN